MKYKIYVGTIMEIKKGFMQGLFKIMYCGMPSEGIFVLAPLVAKGYQGFSPNIFYNLDSKVIQIFDRDFDVIEVTPEYIVLGD